MQALKYKFKDNMIVLNMDNSIEGKRFFDVYLNGDFVEENDTDDKITLQARISFKTLDKLLKDYAAFKKKGKKRE